ncbi:hypothetical protein GCM10010531_23440 [Blastococcus jejuensis]|uniref:Uncharacterized protein n=1 Tax=Blastococcus jejuensis TaxID=351224 RepID=A0ABP6P6G8_9ACTN
MQHGAGSDASNLRAQVQERWGDLEAGRRTRSEISRWAEERLEDSTPDEELVIQGLLFLQAVDLVTADRRGEPGADTPVHVDDPEAPFLVTAADVSRGLQSWLEELSACDADPRAWMSRYMQRLIRDFAANHGFEDARSFADKLVASGELTAQDAARALESDAAGDTSNEIGSP